MIRRHPNRVETSQRTIPNREQRRERLAAELCCREVPFPIAPEVAVRYLSLFDSEVPFGTGSLTSEFVDLDTYADFQVFENLSPDAHQSWAELVSRQQQQKSRFACRQYLQGEQTFEIQGDFIPDYYLLNARIYQQTGWQLATVSQIIPAHIFFHCHSRRFFPVTTFMRPLGTDYLEEPDIGHDIAGHVATFTIPEVAYVMNQHGLANERVQKEKHERMLLARSEEERQAIESEAQELLMLAGRIYWFTVEFGLIQEAGQLRAFGAGILSSPGETRHSIESDEPNRIWIDPTVDSDLLRLATTDYLISEFQKTYFVLKSFDSLRTLTCNRILKVIRQAQRLPHATWREVCPGDQVYNVGRTVIGPNEKYFNYQDPESADACLLRTAQRNLGLIHQGLDLRTPEEQDFYNRFPSVPANVLKRYNHGRRKKCSGQCAGCRKQTQPQPIDP